MNLIFGLLFRGPFWIQLVVAAALVWLGMVVQEDEANRQIARAALLEQAPPATISLADAKPGNPSRVPVELSVTAQVALDHNTRLVRKTNFIKTGEDLLYVLVDPEADADVNVAQAGIVIDPDQLDAFTNWLVENSTDFGAAGPVVTINGVFVNSSSDSHARDAMKNQGMTIAEDFFFIEPFITGREASLAAKPSSAAQLSWPIFGVAALMALLGALKLTKGRGKFGTLTPGGVPARGMADSSRSAAGVIEAYGLVEVRGVPALAADLPSQPSKTAKTIKPPKSKVSKLVWLVVLIVGVAIAMGQNWATMLMPFAILGLMYFGLRRGMRQITTGIECVIGNFTAKATTSQAKPVRTSASSIPAWASVQKDAPTATSSDFGFAANDPIRSGDATGARSTVKFDGPIRPGFSFKDLLPQPKQKSFAGPDPFERLAQQRLRQERDATRR